MALSGSKTNNFTSGFGLKLNWSAVQNITNNQSTITVQVYLALSNASINVGSRSDGSITIDGLSKTTTYNAVRQSTATTKDFLLSTWSRTVNHSADGTKSFTVSANYPILATLSGDYFGNVSVSTTGTLDTIPRASQPRLSVTTQNLGSAITIYTDRASTDFTHTLTYAFENQSGQIATGVTTSQSWTLLHDLASAIPNAMSGTGTITCKTYNGETLVGSKSVSFTATVPNNETFQPTVSVWDVSEATTQPEYIISQGIFVATKSSLRVQSTASGTFGATITSYNTYVDGFLYTGNDIISRIINTVGTVTVSVHATDSRGNVGINSTPIHLDFVKYYPPRILGFSAKRSPDENGKDINVMLDYTVPTIREDGIDTGSFAEVFYRPSGGSFTSLYFIDLAGPQYDTRTIANKLDVNTSYEVELRVTDFWTTVTQRVSIGTGYSLINFNASGKGMAIGKVSEIDGFEVATPTYFQNNTKYQDSNLIEGGVRRPGYVEGIPSSPGWYRVARFDGDGRFGYGGIIEMEITRVYANWNNEAHKVTLIGAWENINFFNQKTVNAQLIRGIRWQYDTNNSYLDIYYSGPNINNIRFSITSVNNSIVRFTNYEPFTNVTSEATMYGSTDNLLGAESGSNDNGTYLRFSDGTMMCYLNRVIASPPYASLSVGGVSYNHFTSYWTFPATFISSPTVLVNGDISAGGPETHLSHSITTTNCIVESGILGVGASTTQSLMAIGRWK